jgi:hypothetical protein
MIRKAGDILSSLFNERFDPVFLHKARTTAGLFTSWAAITDEAGIAAAASHSGISELERGILLIEAEHPGWRQILQTKQSQLLEIVQRRYLELEIRGIDFRLSREPHVFSAAPGAPAVSAAETPGQNSAGPPDIGPFELSAAAKPEEVSPQTNPAEEEAYNLLKKQLEASIKRRNRPHRPKG